MWEERGRESFVGSQLEREIEIEREREREKTSVFFDREFVENDN